ncbi:MAG: FAD-dependent oxidoreductase [Clostridia bacterium]|nr:FAD-dependent oxidoreductase [Clostridia bacterium]
MNPLLPCQNHEADICVIGGGLAGLIAAVSAARHGAHVLLMQDRPMLGGNASSEVRMWVRGAAGKENRETGILQELELENIYRNPTMNYSLWDSVMLQAVLQEKNITLLLNCSCMDCETENGRIVSVTGWQLNTYSFHRVHAHVFLDCSGDSVLAPISGAAYRVGREGKAEFDEYGAPETADRKTMGNSCLIQARETDHPCPFTPPEWAYVYPDDESMYNKDHDFTKTCTNFWWMELGGERDTIADAQEVNMELLRVAFGVWDHIKNHGDHGAENWELEWVGFLPGKRESRRYEGDYILNQRDLEEGHDFPDTVAFGGWTMDNHDPRGLRCDGYSSVHIKPKVPYAIPYRCLYSRNVSNLMFAGRNISATHMALSSTRVMATCSVIGQAAGTAAALCSRYGCLPRDIYQAHMDELQAQLLDDGCLLPGLTRPPRGTFSTSFGPDDAAVLENGWERPHEGNENRLLIPEGCDWSIALNTPADNLRMRLALDPDFTRESISPRRKTQTFTQRANIFLNEPPVKMPAPLLKDAEIVFWLLDTRKIVQKITDNHQALLWLPLPKDTVAIFVRNVRSWGGEGVGLFACDIC